MISGVETIMANRNLDWNKANMSINWVRYVDVIVILVAMVLVGFLGFYFYQPPFKGGLRTTLKFNLT